MAGLGLHIKMTRHTGGMGEGDRGYGHQISRGGGGAQWDFLNKFMKFKVSKTQMTTNIKIIFLYQDIHSK